MSNVLPSFVFSLNVEFASIFLHGDDPNMVASSDITVETSVSETSNFLFEAFPLMITWTLIMWIHMKHY